MKTSNADVEKAVTFFESLATDHKPTGWPAVRMDELTLVAKALRDQEAENAELRKIKEERWAVVATRNAAVMRTEKADALLRKCRDEFNAMPKSLAYDLTLVREITAHLGGEHE